MKTKLAVLLALLAGLAAIPAASQAFPSYPGNCTLTDSIYGIGNGNYQGHTHLGCALPTSAVTEGCLQDYASGRWNNYECYTVGPAYASVQNVYNNVNPFHYSARGWREWGYTRVSCASGFCSTSNASGYLNL